MAKKTEHFGASEERDAIRRKVRRMILATINPVSAGSLKGLVAWIDKRTERFKRRKGGL